jgi:hypothetical protein
MRIIYINWLITFLSLNAITFLNTVFLRKQLSEMTDVHEPEARSYNRSQIRNKNTKPEVLIRRFLYANGFRYRINDKKLPGKPDIVLSKYKTTTFINECFMVRKLKMCVISLS